MSVLWRKLGRDMRSAKVMLVSILLVIGVGTATFVGMTTMWTSLEGARADYYRACRMADVWVDLKRAPLTEARRLTEIAGVGEARARIASRATVDLEDVAAPLTAEVVSLDPREASPLNGVVVMRGRGLMEGRPEEALLHESFASARGIEPGDTIRIVLDGRRHELRIVGTALSSEFAYLISPGGLIPDPAHHAVLYVQSAWAEDVTDMGGACNQVVVRLTGGAREAPERAMDEIERRLEAYGVFDVRPRSRQTSHEILAGELAELQTIAVVLPSIFLGIAALVLNILMSRLAEQQRGIVGTLKALGYTNAELGRHYLTYGLAIGAAGGVVGVGLGWLMALGLTIVYRDYFTFPTLEARPIWWSFAGGMGIAMAFAALGAVRGTRRVLALRPAEAMRPRPPASGGAILLERITSLWRRLGFRWQMVVRTVWRHKMRTLSGVFAAAMGASLTFVTFYFLDSMEYMLAFQFEKVLVSDYDLTFSERESEAALLEARRLPGVTYAEGVLTVACELRNGHRSKRTAITGVAPGARLTVPRTADGAPAPVPSSGLLMARRLAEQLDVEAGGVIELTPVEGRREARVVRVASVVDGFLGTISYADRAWLGGAIGEAGSISGVQLEVVPTASTRDALLREVKSIGGVEGLADHRRTKEQLSAVFLESLRYSVTALVAMAGIIFFGSILTSSLISLSERRREMATLIAIGYTRGQVSGVFLRESLLINMTGAIIGLPLGRWLSELLVEVNVRDVFRLPLVSSPSAYLATLVLAAAFTLLAHWFVRRSVHRWAWQSSLKAGE